MLPSGHKKYLVRRPQDLEPLLMHAKVFAAEIAHNVSARKRVAIIEKARKMNIKVLNGHAKVAKVEKVSQADPDTAA